MLTFTELETETWKWILSKFVYVEEIMLFLRLPNVCQTN